MIFTTKNNELAILGRTLTETKASVVELFDAFERGGVKGEAGILDTLLSNGKQSPLTPEMLDSFERFKNEFNNSFLSAEALAENFSNIDGKIVNYAKTCKNGEMTTKGFEASLNKMTLSAKASKMALSSLATAGNMLFALGVSKAIEWGFAKLYELSHAEEIAAKKAKETADKSKETAASYMDEQQKLTELIEKYKELTSSDAQDASARAEIKDIQSEITDLVGSQADNLDLVNKKLGMQIHNI